MITREMLKRCLNEKCQAFCALDEDVKKAIEENEKYQECLWHNGYGVCSWKSDHMIDGNPHRPWRLSPDTPTEPEYEDYNVMIDVRGFTYLSVRDTGNLPLFTAITHSRFLGIIYRDNNGVETLRTSVDASFGTPVRVRFAKEGK